MARSRASLILTWLVVCLCSQRATARVRRQICLTASTDHTFDVDNFDTLKQEALADAGILDSMLEEGEDEEDPHPLRTREWKIEVSSRCWHELGMRDFRIATERMIHHVSRCQHSLNLDTAQHVLSCPALPSIERNHQLLHECDLNPRCCSILPRALKKTEVTLTGYHVVECEARFATSCCGGYILV